MGLQVRVSIDMINIERILRYLRESNAGLDLESIALVPEEDTEGRFRAEVSLRQTAAWPERWDPGSVLVNAGSSGQTHTTRHLRAKFP